MSSASPSASCPAVNTGRRRWLAGALAAPWLLGQGAAQAQQATLQIGQSAALTGPLGELGQAMRHGAQAGKTARKGSSNTSHAGHASCCL